MDPNFREGLIEGLRDGWDGVLRYLMGDVDSAFNRGYVEGYAIGKELNDGTRP